MRTTTAFALALFVTTGATSAAPERNDPTALLSAARARAGGDAWDDISAIRMAGTLATSGLEGTFEAWEELRSGRWVTRFDLSVATGAEGFDGEQAWNQDPSGDVVPTASRDAVGRARNQAYLACRGYWFPDRWPAEIETGPDATADGRTYRVLRVTPEGGRPMELWLDAETLLLDRIVETGAQETTTTILGDYRPVGALLLPHSIRSGNGKPEYDTLISVDEIALDPEVPAATFELPTAEIRDVELADGATSTTIPFELLNNHIYLLASVGASEPMRFLVDTGGVNLLTRETATALGLETVGSIEGKGVGEGSVDIGVVRLESFQLGAARFDNPLFYVVPFGDLEQAEGLEIAGLVGFELFRRFVVEIDYSSSLLTLTLPDAFHYDGPGIAVPFVLDERTPVVEGTIDGISGTFSIDTGSRSTLDLMGPFVAEHDLESAYAPRLEALAGWGIGGGVRAKIARAGKLTLGSVVISDLVIELTDQASGAYADRYLAGNVGSGLLKRFDLVLDYRNHQILFEPNGTKPEPFDRSGLWINAAEGAFVVVDVIPGSPAAVAGLAAKDRILAVDGTRTDEIRLPDLRQRFRTESPGREIVLRVESNGETSERRLVLRDLV